MNNPYPPAPPPGNSYGVGSSYPPTGSESNGKALAAMVCGIIGIFIAGIILGILAIVLGATAKRDMNEQPGRWRNEGQATAGVVLGIIDVVLGVIFLIYLLNR